MSEYTIIGRAWERAKAEAEKQGWTEEETAEKAHEFMGELVAHHQLELKLAVERQAVRRGALKARLAEQERELREAQSAVDVTRYELEELATVLANETQHDRLVLLDFAANCEALRSKRAKKTQYFAWGPLSRRAKTTRPKVVLLDEEAAKQQFPEFVATEEKLRWGDLKKALTVTPDGAVLDPNGNEVAGDVFAATPATSEDIYTAKVAGVKFDLAAGGGVTDDDGTDDGDSPEGGTIADDDDPFDDGFDA